MYDELIVMATNSELRGYGMLLPCHSYCPCEIDIKAMKRRTEVYEINSEYRTAIIETLIGNVVEHFLRLNSGEKPTILFADSIPSSRMFVGRFIEAGITAAHIDGEQIYYGGDKYVPSSTDERNLLFDKSESGEVTVISNRFVLREGLNLPWLAHGIAACRFGSEAAYIQAGGRLLRASPGLDHVVWQDHAGNCARSRYDTLNADRVWKLNDTAAKRKADRKNIFETGAEPQEITCPRCARTRLTGSVCPDCGHTHKCSVRYVIQLDGRLQRVDGKIVRQKTPVSSEQRAWDSCFWASVNARTNWTFNQVRRHYHDKFGEWPPDGLRNMPQSGSSDWDLPVKSYFKKRRRSVDRKPAIL